MKNELIDKSVSQRICKHMNCDHQDSVVAYASFYGGVKQPINAKLIEITNEYMNISVDGEIVQIKFDHILQDSSDAHKTLVSMIKNIPK